MIFELLVSMREKIRRFKPNHLCDGCAEREALPEDDLASGLIHRHIWRQLEKDTMREEPFKDMPGTRFSKAEMASMRRAARDEAGVLAEFWSRIKALGRKVPFAESIVAAAYCAMDPATPTRVKALILGALAYFVMPLDGIPDILPILGFTDDAAVIAATIAAIRLHMSEAHWEKARQFLKADGD